MKLRQFLQILLPACALCVPAAEEAIAVDKFGDTTRLIPLSITGYSGEVDRVLRFDLEIAGFLLVAPDVAQYNLAGANNGQVAIWLMNRGVISAQLYPGLPVGGEWQTQGTLGGYF